MATVDYQRVNHWILGYPQKLSNPICSPWRGAGALALEVPGDHPSSDGRRSQLRWFIRLSIKKTLPKKAWIFDPIHQLPAPSPIFCHDFIRSLVASWILQDTSDDTSPPARQGVPAPALRRWRPTRSFWRPKTDAAGAAGPGKLGVVEGSSKKFWGLNPKKWGDVTYWSISQLFWFKMLVGKGKNGVESWKFSEVFLEVSGKVPSGNPTWRTGEFLCNSSIFFPLKNHSYSATFGSLIGSNITKPFFPIGSVRAMFDLSNWIQLGVS